MFNYEQQQKEIETISERNIKIRLSDADCDRISDLCGEYGITVAELLENFIGDLVDGTRSNGSDERDLAQDYFYRCSFARFPENTLLHHLLTWGRNPEEYLQLLDYIEQNEEEKKYLEEHPEEVNEEHLLSLDENIEWWKEQLDDMSGDWKTYEEPDMEKEISTLREWIKAKDEFKSNRMTNKKKQTRDLYVAYNKEENFKALVLAEDKKTADNLMSDYSKDANLTPDWIFNKTSIEKVENDLFDCDYLIQDAKFETGDVVYLGDVRKYLLGLEWDMKIFVATETDGLNVTNLVMVMEVAQGTDFEEAAILASTRYCFTRKGRRTYEGNCNCFNWGDFDTYVPNSICEKFGIRKLQSNVAKEFIFDQQLVNEQEIFPEE